MNKPFELGVTVGRFQTLHTGHVYMIEKAAAVCEKVGIFVGSSQESGTAKNPYTYEQRERFLREVFGDTVEIYPLPDIGVGNTSKWGDYVLKNVRERFGKAPDLLVSGKEERRVSWFDSVEGVSVAELYVSKIIDMSASAAVMGNPAEAVSWLANKISRFGMELKAGEIVRLTPKGCETLSAGRDEDLKICSFMWTYYGYPNAVYEGVTVETMRTRNGEIMAENDIKAGRLPDVDYVCGVPDSGTPHAIGYANRSGIPFARPFIKYTPTWPRSFMPTSQTLRNQVAKMKLIPVHELIEGKRLLFVDDSIVRGTQMRETVAFLYENGLLYVKAGHNPPPITKVSASMKKDELIAYAKEHGIEIDEKATKAVIIETIENAEA